jgi:hypothetical protein
MTSGYKNTDCYKSKGEEQIARFLTREGINYFYEHPVAVQDSGHTKIWYPDFYLPELGLIIEYFGVNGDRSYDQRTHHKMQVYQQSGIEGLFLTKESFRGCWPETITTQIESVLKNRLNVFYRRERNYHP